MLSSCFSEDDILKIELKRWKSSRITLSRRGNISCTSIVPSDKMDTINKAVILYVVSF